MRAQATRPPAGRDSHRLDLWIRHSWLRRGDSELGVPLLQPDRVRLARGRTGYPDELLVHLLQAVAKHRPVDLAKHVGADLDHEVWPDPDDIAVECGVVDLADGHAVRHYRLTVGSPVRDDVGRVEQLDVAKAAQGTLRAVSGQHPGAEQRQACRAAIVRGLSPSEPIV